MLSRPLTVTNDETEAGVLTDSVSYSGLGYVNPIGQAAGAGVLTDAGGDGTCAGTFADTGIYALSTGVTYEVQLTATVGTGDTADITASAVVDPTFAIASDVTDPSDYSILYNEAYQPPIDTVPDGASTLALLACVAALLLTGGAKLRALSD